jgi:hypothetical protein
MASNDLTTLSRVKTYGNVTISTDDPLLQNLITAVSVAVIRYLGRNILSAQYTAVMDGNGAALLPLPQYPITAVSSLKINNVAKSALVDYGDGGFIFRGREVGFQNASDKFTLGIANVAISYTAGYATDAVPSDLEQAVVEMVVVNYQNKDKLGWVSKSLAGESVTMQLDQKAMSNSVKLTLQSYMNVLPIK